MHQSTVWPCKSPYQGCMFKQLLHVILILKGVINVNYNIPRACLLNRSPVPAMDLKSNRSGL